VGRSKADAAFRLGVLSLLCNLFFVPGILAIVWGGRDRQESRKAGRGFVLGIIGTGIWALLAVALVIAIIGDGHATSASKAPVTSTTASAAGRAQPDRTPHEAAADRARFERAADDQGIIENAEADRLRTEKAAADEAVSAAAASLQFSGSGSKDTERFTLPVGAYKLVWTASSSSHFAVGIHVADGSYEVLIDESSPDPPTGEAQLVSDGAASYLSVDAPYQTWSFSFMLA